MPDYLKALGRAIVGRGGRSADPPRLRKAVALPVFAADALSSVAYAPDEILLTLALAGSGALLISPWVGLGIALIIAAIIASYRQTVREYPQGGGDVAVAQANLGRGATLTTASAALVDYALTAAVSASCAAQYLGSVFTWARPRALPVALALLAVIMLAVLRGVRGGGRVRAVFVYAFMAALGVTAVAGYGQALLGNLPRAASAAFEVVPEAGLEAGLTGLAGAFLVLRAFGAGSVAFTGVETIAASVPRFQAPRGQNAAKTLGVLGVLIAAMLLGVLGLARLAGVQYVADPATSLRLPGGAPLPEGWEQVPVLSQIAQATFRGQPFVYIPVVLLTAVLLAVAATTAFGAVPVLAARLAQDSYLPKQLYRRGDRRVAAGGIIGLAVAAGLLVTVFDAQVTSLIQLYVVGVFTSMTLGQWGMIRHWSTRLRLAPTPAARRSVLYSRAVSGIGLLCTAIGLGVVLVTKFTHGAWLTLLLMGGLVVAMQVIRHHYDTVAAELSADDAAGEQVPGRGRALPPRLHGLVLVSRLHRASLRAIAFARATRPARLEVVTVELDADETGDLTREWAERAIPVPLTVLDSPARDVTGPVLEYVRHLRQDDPRELVVVFIPEYLVQRWWERWLHNRSAARLTRGLRRIPGVAVASVPWRLGREPEADGL